MKKKLGSILAITIALILIVGISYAYFIYNSKGKSEITFNGGKLDIVFKSDSNDKLLVTGLYPKSDKDGLEEGISYKFTLTGYNESTKNMHYRIYMDDTEITPEDKVRFSDDLIKVAVYKNGELVLPPTEIGDYSNPGFYFDYIKRGSSALEPEISNFEIKLWISDKVRITSNMCEEGYTCFSQEEYPKLFFEKILKIEADFSYDDIGHLTYDANGGTNTPKKTSLATQKVTSQKPVMEGKAFLGWSSTPNGEVEYISGARYTGKAKVLYAIYSDVINVMDTFPSPIIDYKTSILNVYYINEDIDTLTTKYNNASIKADLTYNNQGKVLGWLEEDSLVNGTQYYNLYVGSDGVTYLNTGNSLFRDFTNLTYIDFVNVDTSLVTDMSYMFYFGKMVDNVATNVNPNLNNLDLSMFNTDNVTTTYCMFVRATALNNLDISSFDTSKVTAMTSMFSNCTSLEELDLSHFDTSNVTTFHEMFYNCESLTDLDVSSFKTSKVTNMYRMFAGCTSLKELDVTNFDTGSITQMSYMFYDCINLETIDVSNFDTKNVVKMVGLFQQCESLESLNVSNFNTENVTDMSYMFNACRELQSLDLSNFNTSNVTNMDSMFQGCNSMTKLDVSSFNTSKVTNMHCMFNNANQLKEIDVSGFDTSNVTNMHATFYKCSRLEVLDVSNFNTSKVTNMRLMFSECNLLSVIDVSNFDTANVTDMGSMFYGCYSVKVLNVSGFNTAKVTDMHLMFYGCQEVEELDVSDFNTINVTTMHGMFDGCLKLVNLDVSNFNTINVTDMNSMFMNCYKVNALDVSNFNTSKVTLMNNMFEDCRSVKELDVSNFDMSNVTNVNSMFINCRALVTIYANSNWANNNISTSVDMFAGSLKLPGYDSNKVDISMANPTVGYFTIKQTA